MKLENKNILITGASGDIGSAILRKLAVRGNRVFAHYFNNLDIIQNIAVQTTAQVIPIKADFKVRESIKLMFEEMKNYTSQVDIVVNAAGIENIPHDPLDTTQWAEVMNVNFFSIVEICRQALKFMNKGVIVNISSIMGKHDIAVPLEFSSYAVSKAALNKFTLNLANHYAPDIRALTISPGYTRTKMWDKFSDADKKECIADVRLRRFIEPSEIAYAVESVIENDAVTAHDIIIDGGLGIKFIK